MSDEYYYSRRSCRQGNDDGHEHRALSSLLDITFLQGVLSKEQQRVLGAPIEIYTAYTVNGAVQTRPLISTKEYRTGHAPNNGCLKSRISSFKYENKLCALSQEQTETYSDKLLVLCTLLQKMMLYMHGRKMLMRNNFPDIFTHVEDILMNPKIPLHEIIPLRYQHLLRDDAVAPLHPKIIEKMQTVFGINLFDKNQAGNTEMMLKWEQDIIEGTDYGGDKEYYMCSSRLRFRPLCMTIGANCENTHQLSQLQNAFDILRRGGIGVSFRSVTCRISQVYETPTFYYYDVYSGWYPQFHCEDMLNPMSDTMDEASDATESIPRATACAAVVNTAAEASGHADTNASEAVPTSSNATTADGQPK